MRVLFITTSYPANTDDPRGAFIHVLAKALVEEGLSVVVLAPGAPGAPLSEERDGVRIRRATYWISRWQALTAGQGGGIIPNLVRRPWLMLQVPALLAKLTWSAISLARDSDVIHAHWILPSGMAGAVAARLCGRPLVITSHGTDLSLAERHRGVASLTRRILQRADRCVGVSRALTAALPSFGSAARQTHFIPLGVEVPSAKNDRTAPSDSDWLRFRDAPSPKFLYVGRLIAGKAVETLIEAAVKATEAGARATYAIVGEGPEMQRLRARVREARASYIIFGGSRAPSQIGAWLSETDGLVLPSLSEGRPVVVIEAMASARAVVASDLPGIRELVIDGVTGVLFPAGDAESLASAFARLVHNPWILGEMGVSAARSFDNERLSAAASAHDHIEMYKELVRPVPASS